MSYATIDDLRSHLDGKVAPTPAYAEKMLHPLPPPKSVDREEFILRHCVGKRVLEFGASGPLHDAIVRVATSVLGVDRDGATGVVACDLDDVAHARLPGHVGEVDVIVCGELLEHLSNPGWFLTRLKRQFAGVPVMITVPNAFSKSGAHWIGKGIENCNRDHVAYYSPKTLSVLLERAGYTYGDLFYYGGDGPTADGLVVVTE